STVPSHGAMFTGLFPSEHGANNKHRYLDDRHDTLAENFKRNGYDTFLFSANPHISAEENFTQGFDSTHHPWDERNREAALRIIRDRISPQDRSNELALTANRKDLKNWSIKATGELAEKDLIQWLEERKGDRPFFAFLNYMDAHHPYVPKEEFRKRVMTPEQIKRSYHENFAGIQMWLYSFGLIEFSPESIDILDRVYDACITELDDLFRRLITTLEEGGYLENTIIVLTGDHGEHLGEHHLLDHQYSLYDGLLRVPLVIHFPSRVPAGRDKSPVVNFDIFRTLLDLTGLKPPPGLPENTVNLLSPRKNRIRMAEYPTDFRVPILSVKKLHPDWDPKPFLRTMTALYNDDLKFIWVSDGTHELYDLGTDPEENFNLAGTETADMKRMENLLKKVNGQLQRFDYSNAQKPNLSKEQMERLQALGYADGGEH
ncbi:MAG: sulfatase-like hydrolase/transferase, partial [Planctomycetes bacterium]|nr:sulfatase-like hydrolase/transferase [Planctomycetota bacterium]